MVLFCQAWALFAPCMYSRHVACRLLPCAGGHWWWSPLHTLAGVHAAADCAPAVVCSRQLLPAGHGLEGVGVWCSLCSSGLQYPVGHLPSQCSATQDTERYARLDALVACCCGEVVVIVLSPSWMLRGCIIQCCSRPAVGSNPVVFASVLLRDVGDFYRKTSSQTTTNKSLCQLLTAACLCHCCVGVFAVLAFVQAIVWLNLSASALVQVCVVVGIIFGLQPALLGATVLAWGNSVPDLINNLAMAQDGFPSMAVAACFASPIFTLLVGMGGALAYGEQG